MGLQLLVQSAASEQTRHFTSLILSLYLTHTANKAKVLYGIPRDPDVAAALAELEDEENESNAEDEKPKVGHVNTIS